MCVCVCACMQVCVCVCVCVCMQVCVCVCVCYLSVLVSLVNQALEVKGQLSEDGVFIVQDRLALLHTLKVKHILLVMGHLHTHTHTQRVRGQRSMSCARDVM